MLSVLIPVYNCNIVNLIRDLLEQIRRDSIIAEILILDDGSQLFKKENQELKKYKEIKYYELNKNKGRSFARNFLAEKASFSYLLFIDCDVKVVREDFLIKYYQLIKKNIKVACGGLIYDDKKNISKENLLRWYYGVKREEKTADKRNRNPYQSFSSFNFLIQQKLFLSIKFPELINTYGHEDTGFGIALKINNIPVLHFDNPLMHLGIEESIIYIHKIEESVKNIDKLYQIISDKKLLHQHVNLLNYINIIKKLRIIFLIKFSFKLLKTLIIKNLLSIRPSLFLMDFYKLGYYFFK